MEPLSFAKHARMLGAELTALVPTKAYITIRRRNAWHGVESRRYRGESAVNTTIDEAKKTAEGWRKQGSHFEILESPAIALLSTEGMVVCTDFHHQNPFGSYDATSIGSHLVLGTPLSEPLHILGVHGPWTAGPNPQSLVTEAHPWMPHWQLDQVTEATAFSSHISESVGSDFMLQWVASPRSNVSARGVFAIAGEFRTANPGFELERALDEYEAAQVARTDAMYTELSDPA